MRLSASLSLAVLAFASFTASAQTTAATPVATKSHKPAAQIIAPTPPMGWNSWNFFAGRVTDKDVRGAADQIVATGMKDAGYRSEEHTSELQSLRHLVCRLLLEKKNNYISTATTSALRHAATPHPPGPLAT